MKLETFFEKFDQFADVPDAVAKMRELILQLAVREARPSGSQTNQVDATRGDCWSEQESDTRAARSGCEKMRSVDSCRLEMRVVPDGWSSVALRRNRRRLLGEFKPGSKKSYAESGFTA